MLRTKQAKKLLTKAEQNHLTEMNIHSVDGFRRTREFHLMCKRDDPTSPEPCWQCREIARKLGWEVE